MNGLKNNRHRHDDVLSRIDHREFERLLGAYYRGQGWQVEYTGTGSTAQRFDGGVDLVLRRDDEVLLVQCKHWNAKQVPHNPVHELLGIMV
ncbi:MAG TPA: restriction endonuclease, partial [Patescibacteria group bacterium]|nr:restriction endonuclease [Patescibacteria group bacterium]